jgi:hypothetical protein
MRTFLSIAQERVGASLTKTDLFNKIKAVSLNERINNRGAREQFSSVLLTGYYPYENISKLKAKGTYMRHNKLFSVISTN